MNSFTIKCKKIKLNHKVREVRLEPVGTGNFLNSVKLRYLLENEFIVLFNVITLYNYTN